jgi:hypothetical protein
MTQTDKGKDTKEAAAPKQGKQSQEQYHCISTNKLASNALEVHGKCASEFHYCTLSYLLTYLLTHHYVCMV